ncbi:AAA family ATPase [Heliophilum fasciatum]|uniref:Putative ATPase n=1 Tax=Heliophilum fasciatum TaxID=35700 RepID=A0A4R2RQT7_9FIRM|nr:ATP-binding protein [Heliophilum fasciatum]MCW2277571.1 putative ATPase [Heliophilum fasciatum]TCP65139.1 putative ATPase [Heliophilum fasciatum]
MMILKILPQAKGRSGIMRLCSVSVEGFRNIQRSKVICTEMVALVSLNSYGKSNLLQAIDFGVDFISSNENTKKKMMSWTKGIPLNKGTASKDFRIEFEMTTSLNNKVYNIIYGYQFRWIRSDETGANIIGEWLKIKIEGKNQKFNILINRDEDKAFYRSSETGRCNTKISIDNNDLIINKLKAFENLYYHDVIKGINSLKVYIERHLDASQSYTPDPIIRKDIDVLEMEGVNNLPRVIYHLKKQYSEKYNLLINAYTQLFPQITELIVEEIDIQNKFQSKIPDDIPFKLDNKIYALYVIDNNLNQPISFEAMSDGAKRVFLLLTNIVIADLNNLSLIAVEEPENSIHPSLLQNYLRVLSQLLGDTKIIITSHSPYIIQYLEPQNIYVGLPKPYGVAQFAKIRKSAQKFLFDDASNLEMSTGDYLFELISGTEDDMKILEKYLEFENHE